MIKNSTEDLLQGKTLTIYWFLLTHENCGIREIQHRLKFSSPSTASYHITKLLEAGLIMKRENDKFCITEPVRTGIMGLYFKIGTKMVPRLLFYLSFYSMGIILYLLLIFSRYPFIFMLRIFFS